jgi:hypothetical protein
VFRALKVPLVAGSAACGVRPQAARIRVRAKTARVGLLTWYLQKGTAPPEKMEAQGDRVTAMSRYFAVFEFNVTIQLQLQFAQLMVNPCSGSDAGL